MSRTVAVCVPARNEAVHLPRLVRSLTRQSGNLKRPLRLVVAANNCTDNTVDVLEGLRHEHRERALVIDILEVEFPAAEAHVGSARRLAMDRGDAWLEQHGAIDGVLLTTDADAVAPHDWVAANLAALEHAELVGGRLCIGKDGNGSHVTLEALHRQIERYWAVVRALEQILDPPAWDPDPRHGDHTAASIALSAKVYQEVGGMPALPCGEDNELVARVRRLGGRVRHCPRVKIAVSPRQIGRVEGGMASEMSRRAAILRAGGVYEVPPAGFWKALFERRAGLRTAWNKRAAESDGAFFFSRGFTAEEVDAIEPATCKNDIAFVERVMTLPSQQIASPAAVELNIAIVGIERLLKEPNAALGRT